MRPSSVLLILASVILVLVCKLTLTDAAALINDASILENSASNEDYASVRNKKDTSALGAQQVIPTPLRRHHLKFGVLGKRYAYGYLGKRNEASQANTNSEDGLDNSRERRAGRPQYGMLG
ncbi:unnamed protein product [Adineta ricciae]|uniref:Uncharacterized protein n=1 Tax=Adineta ricciae TaxID=249248 RepID=A0A815A9V4_ADIRI|nr:unnamed protein product [Adineta ricciae]